MEENEEVEAKMKTHQLPHIPEDIVLRILSKLPVKSLPRFRGVYSRWRFLISDPNFTLSTPPRHQIVVTPINNPPGFPIHVKDDEGSVIEMPKPNPSVSECSSLDFMGSCNGLLLFRARRATGSLLSGFAMTRLLRNEISKVPMPEHGEERESVLVLGLGVLGGCLLLVLWGNYCTHSLYVEVLAMKKYSDKSSWTRLFIISDVTRLLTSVPVVPLCITRKAVVLVLVNECTIWAFNSMENSHRKLPIGNTFVGAAMFVESLASPHGKMKTKWKGSASC